MEKGYQKYTVKIKDTIAAIAGKLNVSKTELIRFHNTHCIRPEDKIRDGSLPVNLTELFIPGHIEFEKDVELAEKIKLGSNQQFPMTLKPYEMTYGVMITVHSEGQSDTIKYNMSVQWTQIDSLHYRVRLERLTDTYINDEEPDLMAEELSAIAATCLYPLELIINRENKITKISNFKTIQNRWEKTKEKLRLYYTGEFLEKFFRLNEKILQYEDSLLQSFGNDYFLHVLFNKLYIQYTEKFQVQHTISFPMIFNVKKVDYRVNQTIDEYINKEGQVLIEMKGELDDPRSIRDFEYESDSPEYPGGGEQPTGTYHAKYYMDTTCNLIHSVYVECSLNLTTTKKVSVLVVCQNKETDEKESINKEKKSFVQKIKTFLQD